jgi:hypothetical protein
VQVPELAPRKGLPQRAQTLRQQALVQELFQVDPTMLLHLLPAKELGPMKLLVQALVALLWERSSLVLTRQLRVVLPQALVLVQVVRQTSLARAQVQVPAPNQPRMPQELARAEQLLVPVEQRTSLVPVLQALAVGPSWSQVQPPVLERAGLQTSLARAQALEPNQARLPQVQGAGPSSVRPVQGLVQAREVDSKRPLSSLCRVSSGSSLAE